MKKIVVVTTMAAFQQTFWCEEVEEKLKKYGYELSFIQQPKLTIADLPYDESVDIVVTSWGSPRCTEEIFSKFPNMKILGHCAGSAAAVSSPELYDHGVRVFAANWMMSRSVAEWCTLMTLLHSRNFFHATSIRHGDRMNWKEHFAMQDLHEMTIGCWGYGDVTKHFLRQISVFEPKRILICSGHASQEELAAAGGTKATLEEVLAQSDVVHCLVGVTPETLHRIGEKELAMMKDGAAILNCGRAGLICEEPLIAELAKGRLYAYLDVFYQEPLPEDSPLYDLPNLIMTPHNAGFPGRKTFLTFLLDEFHRAELGEKCLGEITRDRLGKMTVEGLGKKKA